MSLYLKLMEDETTHSAHHQQLEMGAALLPSLNDNIIEGNSLLTLNEDLFSSKLLVSKKSLNFRSTFKRAFDQGGFDLLIGNPPYIKEYTNKAAFDDIKKSEYYQGKMDIWYMFAARGIDWLKPKTGILALIATNNWMTNAGASKLRMKLFSETNIDQLIDFGDYKVFKDAGIQTMILIASRNPASQEIEFDFRRISLPRPTLDDAKALLEKRPAKGLSYLRPKLDRRKLGAAPLTFAAVDATKVLDRIQGRANFALDRSELTQGIVPNIDRASAKNLQLIPEKRRRDHEFTAGDGVFVVPDSKFKSPTAKEKTFLKPLYEPIEVERYGIFQQPVNNIIYSVRNRHKTDTPPPRIMDHLTLYQEIMARRRETLSGRQKYYHLHWPREERFFVKRPKILSVRKCAIPTFAYTENEAYVMMAFNVIRSNRIDLKYLTAVLNSEVIKFWLTYKGKIQGNNFQVDTEPLLSLPIHAPSKSDQQRIGALVDRIIERRGDVISSTTSSALEAAERLVRQTEETLQSEIADLYGLSDDERLFISGVQATATLSETEIERKEADADA